MYKELSVPENELKAVIAELLEYCDEKEEEGELGKTKFSSPVREEEIEAWEKENGVRISETYKQWLRFTGDCIIDGTTAEFYSPKNFRTEHVPEDLVIIGEEVGDGEVVCFSKETGSIMSYFEGEVNLEYETFDKTIKEVLRMMGKREIESKEDILQRLEYAKTVLEEELMAAPGDEELLEMIAGINNSISEMKM